MVEKSFFKGNCVLFSLFKVPTQAGLELSITSTRKNWRKELHQLKKPKYFSLLSEATVIMLETNKLRPIFQRTFCEGLYNQAKALLISL